MRPITFECKKMFSKTIEEISSEISDMVRWPEFNGYAILPGIELAEYELRTSDMVDSRIRVRNLDGSTHVEEILEWDLSGKIEMKIYEFSPPLSHMATHFIETWHFEHVQGETAVTRSFQLFGKRPLTRPFLWIISLFFRKAIENHLAQIAWKSFL